MSIRNTSRSIVYIYPHANPMRDFTVVDNSDGTGQKIVEWKLVDPKPTESELDAAWVEVKRLDKKVELNNICTEDILKGAVLSNGHEYGFSMTDQTNMEQQHAIMLRKTDIAEVMWKTKDAGIIKHTRDGFFNVVDELASLKWNKIAKYWKKKNILFSKAKTLTDIDSIEWNDIIPPVKPTGLTATGGSLKIDLSWTHNTDIDLEGYNIYTATATPQKVNSSLVTDKIYTVTGLQASTSYSYYITAVDIDGNESIASDTVTATTTA